MPDTNVVVQQFETLNRKTAMLRTDRCTRMKTNVNRNISKGLDHQRNVASI